MTTSAKSISKRGTDLSKTNFIEIKGNFEGNFNPVNIRNYLVFKLLSIDLQPRSLSLANFDPL